MPCLRPASDISAGCAVAGTGARIHGPQDTLEQELMASSGKALVTPAALSLRLQPDMTAGPGVVDSGDTVLNWTELGIVCP